MAKRPSAAQQRARRLFAQRARNGSFGKRAGRAARRVGQKATHMAKKATRRGRGFAGKSRHPAMNGAFGGVGRNIGKQVLGQQIGGGIGLIAVGHFTKEPTLAVLGGVELGQQLSSGIQLGNLGLGNLLGGGQTPPAGGGNATTQAAVGWG